jgi:large repetitive protein
MLGTPGRNWLLTSATRCFAILLLTIGLAAHGAMPRAGSKIDNQAYATFLDEPTSIRATLTSNVVSVTVAPLEAIRLTADRTVRGGVNSQIVFAHTLTNTGNKPITLRVDYSNRLEDDFELGALALHQDVVANGILDSGEPFVANGGTLALEAGESVELILVGTIPGIVPVGAGVSAKLLLSVKSTTDETVSASNTDTVIATDKAVLTLGKSASTVSARVEQEISYALQGFNSGSTGAGGIPVTIDGQQQTRIVIRDAIPSGTGFVAFQGTSGPARLYHIAGSPNHTYISVPPSDLSSVDAVAFALTSVGGGLSYGGEFKVMVKAGAPEIVRNTGQIFYADATGGVAQLTESNLVQTATAEAQPAIGYYTNGNFSTPTTVARLGNPLFVEARAPLCNQQPTKIETRTILITSGVTGDIESYLATETGPDTGRFRVLPHVPTTNAATVIAENHAVETQRNDTLTARIDGCGAGVTITRILIDPSGVVFDSRSDRPLAGARVALIDAATDRPATVLDFDGVTEAANEIVTGADGSFQFPVVSPGNYRLRVIPVTGYSFPSTLSGADLPTRVIDVDGSFGRSFEVSAARGTVLIDVPLDAKALDGLLIKKEAKRSVVEVGDFVDYVITVSNATSNSLNSLQIHDILPAGFAYERGSARLQGVHLPDPVRKSGGGITFSLGDVAQGAETKLGYRVRVGPGALQGDGVNQAQAIAGSTRSNVASAKVKVQPGVFSDKGFIIGKIFVDCDRNREQDSGELGIPGVRLLLEDGAYAITDSEGKYSFYGISPRTHVLKLDATTLPGGAELETVDNRNAGDAGSRFVDLKKGELHKANFAEGSCTDEVLQQVKARRMSTDDAALEVGRSVRTQLSGDGLPLSASDPRALASTGIVGGVEVPQGSTSSSATSRQKTEDRTEASRTAVLAAPDLDKALPTLDNSLGFVFPTDNEVLPFPQVTIQVKGTAGGSFRLTVNGAEVSTKRVGKKSVLAAKQLQAWEFVGVDLRAGKNTLAVSQMDQFGNSRGSETISVIAPDILANVQIELPKQPVPADGLTPVAVTVRLADADGVPVTVRTPLTLETSLGRFDVPDLNEGEAGTQVFVEQGVGRFLLIPPRDPGQAVVRAISGVISGDGKVDFVPELRPMIVAGLVEGTINLRSLDTKALVPAREQDGFEQELTHFATEMGSEKHVAAARAALFLKGKIKGEYLLTAAYDSDKDTKERLFRDIQPDEFYPVYGDSSIKGFDAQSTSRLYVRIDKEKSFVLYGDLTTNTLGDWRKLSNYSRSLTGIKGHYETDRISASTFASRASTKQVIDEFCSSSAALGAAVACIAGPFGTSGPFELSNRSLLVNSEQVEVLVRSRNQLTLVLKTTALSRFLDYELEALTGRIILRAPVPSLDADLNPVTLRVTYEVEQGGEKFWVYGVDGTAKLSDSIEVGGIYVEDKNPEVITNGQEAGIRRLSGVSASVKLGERTVLTGELAQTKSFSGETGQGKRVELKYQGVDLAVQLFWGESDERFNNPGAILSKGREEAGAKATYRTDERTRVIGEAIHTQDQTTGERRHGQLVTVERMLTDKVRGEIGIRHVQQILGGGEERDEFTSVRGKLTATIPSLENATLFGEYEQAIEESDKKLLAIGGDYQISSKAKAYARHEFISTLAGPFALNSTESQHTTVFGLDTAYMKDGHLFNEYRMNDAVAGREAEAAIGLRNRWGIAPGFAFNTNVERVHGVGGESDNESLAVALGVEYTASPQWKGTGRLETRNGTVSDSALSSFGIGYKLSNSWTLLGKNLFSITKNDGDVGGKKVLERFQLGFAYRPVDSDRWNGLVRVERKYESDTTQDDEANRAASILSSHVNFQPRKDWLLNGRYAAKLVRDQSGDIDSKASAHLLAARATYDITNRWDASLNASVHWGSGASARQYGLGLEVGYLLTANLWLSVGYNALGFRDSELAGPDYTSHGGFFRLRFKFDEDLLSRDDSPRGSGQ